MPVKRVVKIRTGEGVVSRFGHEVRIMLGGRRWTFMLTLSETQTFYETVTDKRSGLSVVRLPVLVFKANDYGRARARAYAQAKINQYVANSSVEHVIGAISSAEAIK